MTALSTVHQRSDGEPDPDRQDFPDRPALTDVVDDVGGPDERGDVARCRPDRHGEAKDCADSGAGLVGLGLRDQGLHRLGAGTGRQLLHLVDHFLGGVGPEQSEQSNEHDQRGHDGEDPVVGQPGGDVLDVVVAELHACSFQGIAE